MASLSKEQRRAIERQKKFVRHMWIHTVRIVQFRNDLPLRCGSGVFYSKGGRLFLLSVLHVFKDPADWFAEVPSPVGGPSLHLRLNKPSWILPLRGRNLRGGRRSSKDGLAWFEIDVSQVLAELKMDKRAKGAKFSIPTYEGPLNNRPDHAKVYGFAAAPSDVYHKDRRVLEFRPVWEIGLRLRGTDSRGFYRFKLQGRHKGHKHYYGCSGAPIADEERTIVGLLTNGNRGHNSVYAAPLNCSKKRWRLSTRQETLQF